MIRLLCVETKVTLKIGILIIFKLCIYVCGYVRESAGPHRVQKRALDILEAEAEAVVGHLSGC